MSLVKVLYFASLRENLGLAEEEVAYDGQWAVSDLLGHLRRRGSDWERALGPGGRVRAAVNQEFAEPATPISDGDEVGLFPPVTGG